jgi:predicted polyphosphate/ATP-dependent NAD kinase
MRKIGLILNPIAGMGGSVGLKGTDGEIYKEAIKMGATPIAPYRLNQFLIYFKNKQKILLLIAPGKMGADLIMYKGIKFEIIGVIGKETSAEDTKRIAKQMVKNGIELLIFCGGDGTARDIYNIIGLKIPVIAIPSGVKMYSSVFALNPRAAAQILDKFLEESVETQEKEVLDIDEDLVRNDILDARLFGYLKVPKILNLTQSAKSGSRHGKIIEENKQEIAEFIIEIMDNDIIYLLGPGTTVKAITDDLKLPKTLLGVDAIYNKQVVGIDLNEKKILDLLKKYSDAEIIISPLGKQGFLFGRGNLQFTPKILKQVGRKNIKIIATAEKMREFKYLLVDTGDFEVDELLKGFTKVVIGYKEELVIKIQC